ncbi:MAG: molecular chaperone DnaJ [Dysgonamonadaceae bacterium]|nr:molecular chaperone DnaJ [Dysgonamonadaceae bacterium]
MKYFHTVTSFADLKKQYRKLAIANHPDKGGSTQAMQEVNAEFEQLFPLWENRSGDVSANTGYENDYAGATAHEYTGYVYNEYRFTGSNYKGQRPDEVCEIMRKWLKETYPHYKFSVTRRNYNSITTTLVSADFEAFSNKAKGKVYKQINHYHLKEDEELTERANEVLQNVYSHVQKAIRQALDKAEFAEYENRSGKQTVLCTKHFCNDGRINHYPLYYSSRKTAEKRMEKLRNAGICCRLTGYNGGYIEFSGYTPETEAALTAEKQVADLAEKQWNERVINKLTKKGDSNA